MAQSVALNTQKAADDISLFDLVVMLVRRRWLIATTTAVCFLVGVLMSVAPRQYAASGMLRVQPGNSGQYRSSQVSSSQLDLADQTSPYVDILQSTTLLTRVAQELDLANSHAFLDTPLSQHQDLNDVAVREHVLRDLRTRLVFSHKLKDEIIRVTCTTTDRNLSARIINTLLNDFVVYLVQVRYGASKRSSSWLITQLDDLKGQVERDQTNLTALQAKLGIVGVGENGSDYLSAQALNSLTKATSDATVNRIVAEAKYRFLHESDPSLIEGEVNLLGGTSSAQAGLLQNLRNAQASQSSEYIRLLQQFGSSYPAVVEAKAQLDETARQVTAEQRRILNQAKLSYSAASANEQMTGKALSDKQSQAFGQRGDLVRYLILQHDYQSHRTLYEGLISRLQEAGITAGLESGEVDIVDLADVPSLPAPPGRIVYLGVSLLSGLILGCVLALLSEALETRVFTSEQVQRLTRLPLLAVLPRSLSKVRLLAPDEDSAFAEAVETLRSSVVMQTGDAGGKVLLVTSPEVDEGKSTVSANLAIVLAQHGKRVLLLDCDLRKCNCAALFSLAAVPGVTDALQGKMDWRHASQAVPAAAGLSLLAAGSPPKTRAALLLGSNEMSIILQQMREHFDYVVVNGPPVLGLSDALLVGKQTDATLLVVRSKKSYRRSIWQALQAMQQAGLHVVGYVLNDYLPQFRESGYGQSRYRPFEESVSRVEA